MKSDTRFIRWSNVQVRPAWFAVSCQGGDSRCNGLVRRRQRPYFGVTVVACTAVDQLVGHAQDAVLVAFVRLASPSEFVLDLAHLTYSRWRTARARARRVKSSLRRSGQQFLSLTSAKDCRLD